MINNMFKNMFKSKKLLSESQTFQRKHFLIGAVILVETLVLLFLFLKLTMINIAVLTSPVSSWRPTEFSFVEPMVGGEAGASEILSLPGDQINNIDTSFQTSPDGASFAYIVKTDAGQAVVLNGQSGRFYPEITFMTFSPDSRRFAYGAKSRDGERVVLDGQEGKLYDWIFTPRFFTPDSGYFVYKTRTDKGDVLVFNTSETQPYDQIYEPLLSADQVYNPLIKSDKIRLIYYGRRGSTLWQGVLESGGAAVK
jgi:hypothetical protein